MDNIIAIIYCSSILGLCFLLWYHIKKQIDWEGKVEFPSINLDNLAISQMILVAAVALIFWGMKGCEGGYQIKQMEIQNKLQVDLKKLEKADRIRYMSKEDLLKIRDLIDEITCDE